MVLMSRRKGEEHDAFHVQLLTEDRGDPSLRAPAGQDTSSTACFRITCSEANPPCPEIGMLTSPRHSSAVPVWISSPPYFTAPQAPPRSWGAADAGRAPRVAVGVPRSQARSRDPLQLLQGSLEPGNIPRTPRGRAQSQVAPPDRKEPPFFCSAGPAKAPSAGARFEMENIHKKPFMETAPSPSGVRDPSVAWLASESPQQRVLSPGQAGMSPQRSRCDSGQSGVAAAPSPLPTEPPRWGGSEGGRGMAGAAPPAPKRCRPLRARPATRRSPGKCLGAGMCL